MKNLRIQAMIIIAWVSCLREQRWLLPACSRVSASHMNTPNDIYPGTGCNRTTELERARGYELPDASGYSGWITPVGAVRE